MIRALAIAAGLAASSCARPAGPTQPDSRLLVHVSPLAVMADLQGVAVITVTVGGPVGAAVSCARVRLEVDGVRLSTVEPDCAPGTEDHEGGVLPPWQVALGVGEHDVTVFAQEPGRREMRVSRLVVVR